MKWRDARKSHPEQESSSVSKVKKLTDVKSLNSLKASPLTEAKISLQDEKDRLVILDIISLVAVTSLETDAFMAFVAYFDMLTVKGTQREVETRKVLKEQLR